MREPQAVLATDLDGTVVGINTFPHFIRFLTRRLVAERRPMALLRLLGVAALRKAHLTGHGALKRVVCEVGPTLPEADVREWAEGVLAEHGHREVMDIIASWEGPTVLTTAAPEFYAAHLARLLGIPEVHGSVVRGGVLVNNEHDAKRVRLAAAGLERVAVFLTDDLTIDGPLAAIADRVLEVGPDGRVRVHTSEGTATP